MIVGQWRVRPMESVGDLVHSHSRFYLKRVIPNRMSDHVLICIIIREILLTSQRICI
jgi:hypothetical protein